MGQQLGFALGCCHFGPDVGQRRFTGREYLRNLYRALESIDTIGNISIEYGKTDFLERVFSRPDDLRPVSMGGDFFPDFHLAYGRIEFDIHIPRRKQGALLTDERVTLDGHSENFRFLHEPSFPLPTTFVYPLGGIEPHPSRAFRLVRDVLEEQSEAFRHFDLTFDYVDPSPYVADCYVMSSEKVDERFAYHHERTRTPGFDKHTFTYSPRRYKSLEEAAKTVFSDLAQEVGVLYLLFSETQRRVTVWPEVAGSVSELVKTHMSRGWTFALRRFRMSKQLDDAMMLLTQYKAEGVMALSNFRAAYGGLYASLERPLLDEDVQSARDALFESPVTETGEMLELLERRRRARVDTVLLVTTALAGGSVGTILTLLLTE
ncbi:MAG TPA: hypothetical protein VHJ34_14965 [Actinomycetota bacterium]|nr:hypothetical protein [Actinomycetota bacterium]